MGVFYCKEDCSSSSKLTILKALSNKSSEFGILFWLSDTEFSQQSLWIPQQQFTIVESRCDYQLF